MATATKLRPKSKEKPKQLNVNPVGDQIIVERDEVRDISPGGIHLPSNNQAKSTYGNVVAVGPGSWSIDGERMIPLSVRVGARVCFGEYAGSSVTIDGAEYVVMRESDIYFVE